MVVTGKLVMPESAQDQGMRAGVDVMAVEKDEAAGGVGSRRRKKVQTELRREHVSSTPKGKHSAQILDSKVNSALSLGTSGTGVEAARAYDAAAVELRGASAVTNFKASGELSGQAEGSVKMNVKKPPTAKPDVRTEFHGVHRLPSGKYRARIWHTKGKSKVSLGRFGTAEEAARAYDAAAVELHGASARTNFKASGDSSGQAVRSVKVKVRKPPAARPDARTEFRGVYRLQSGKYRAQIWDSKGKSSVPLGSFGTAEEAAMAYDAAAVKLYGAAARTNLEQKPTAAAADDGDVSSMDLPNDYPELPPLDFSESLIPGPQMDDLRTDLPPANWQLVHEFFKDFDQVVA